MGISGPQNGGTVPYEAILCEDIPLHSPFSGLIYIYIYYGVGTSNLGSWNGNGHWLIFQHISTSKHQQKLDGYNQVKWVFGMIWPTKIGDVLYTHRSGIVVGIVTNKKGVYHTVTQPVPKLKFFSLGPRAHAPKYPKIRLLRRVRARTQWKSLNFLWEETHRVSTKFMGSA